MNSYLCCYCRYNISCSISIIRTFFSSVVTHVSNRNKFKFQNEFKKKIYKADSKIVSPDLLLVTDKTPKKHRNEELSNLQYFGEILYGIHPVHLALLKNRRKFHQLFTKVDDCDDLTSSNELRQKGILKLASKLNIPIRNVNVRGLKYLAPNAVHQGVCLDASPLPLPLWNKEKYAADDIKNKTSVWLVLDEVLDPMNVGAIIRSSYYFGVTKIFTVKGSSCKLSPTVSKASSGALEVANIYQIENLIEFLQEQKAIGKDVVSTLAYCDSDNGTKNDCIDISNFNVTKPTVLILGNEGTGISPEIQKLCNKFISISPKQNMHQGIDSLNVSVAAGIILHSMKCSHT